MKYSWIVWLWYLLSSDYYRILFFIRYILRLCEMVYACIWIAFLLRCYEPRCCSLSMLHKGGCLTGSKFQWFKGDEKPWIGSSFIFLFGHVCWAGGLNLNNSAPVYREMELPDRDQLHARHRELGRKRRRAARDERNHGVVKTTESLKWSGYLPCELAWVGLWSRHTAAVKKLC